MSAFQSPRVAIIGASGIGRHHANWWRLEGAQVVAFVGRTPETVAKTAQMLKETFQIDARGYTDVGEMLRREHPEIVDVCSPPNCHAEHVQHALQAGCHVLCEKPFYFDTQTTVKQMLETVKGLIQLANRQNRQLGICTQYSAGTSILQELYKQVADGDHIHFYCGHLESPAKGRSPDPYRVWVDLSPHPISVLLSLFPKAEIDWNSVKTVFEGYSAIAKFQVVVENQTISCEIITRNTTEPPANIREFIFNDKVFRIEGERDENGIYMSRIEGPHGVYRCEDFMRLLIRDFLRGKLVADAATGFRNLEIMLWLMETTTRG